MTKTTQQVNNKVQARERINQLQREMESKLNEAEMLAVEFKIGFGQSIAYGMGGRFDCIEDYTEEELERREDEGSITCSNGGAWFPSSQSC